MWRRDKSQAALGEMSDPFQSDRAVHPRRVRGRASRRTWAYRPVRTAPTLSFRTHRHLSPCPTWVSVAPCLLIEVMVSVIVNSNGGPTFRRHVNESAAGGRCG